jgi:proline racemase
MPELERIKNGFFNRYPDRITTIDSHTQGEPTRLLVGGVGDLPGPQ